MIAFDHVQVAMPAGGEDRARAFYTGVLGLTEEPKPAAQAARGGCWFAHGPMKVHLGVEQGFRPARKAHIAFAVADLAAIGLRLAASGHECLQDGPLDGRPRFFSSDPFGNRLEFVAAA